MDDYITWIENENGIPIEQSDIVGESNIGTDLFLECLSLGERDGNGDGEFGNTLGDSNSDNILETLDSELNDISWFKDRK